MALEKYVDDDLITTALLFGGFTQEDITNGVRRDGSIRAYLDGLTKATSDDTRKKAGLITGYLNNLGTEHLADLMAEGAGLDKADVEQAIYWAQRDAGGTATPTLDQVLYQLGGATGRTKTQGAIDFAATIRPTLQTLGRGDTGLMTTRTQYRTGQRPTAQAPALGAPAVPGQPAAAPAATAQAIPSPPKAPIAKIGGPRMGIAGPGATTPRPGAQTPGGAAKTPGTATAVTPGGDKPTDPFPTDPSKVRDWVARNNPEWLYLLDIPEVANIIKDPSTWEEGADDADLRGRLMQTQWWQKTEPAAREWLKLKAQDPASSNDQLAKRKTFLKNQAQQTGITVADADLDRLAEDSLRYAWDDTEIQANLGNYFVYAADRLTGAAQATRAHLEQAARDWLVPIDDKTVGNWVTQVIKGESTTDYFDTYLAQQAGSLFPQLADPISRGISPTQWMAPYKSIAAQTLELNPEDIDLRDPKWMRAVSQVDDKGARSAMSLYDWTNLIKTDDSYGFDKTQQGRDHGASLARNVAAQFGFATGGGL